jgi:hypothetical protein
LGGQVFFGTGTVNAIAPTNTITVKGANVIFNGLAGSVSLGGGVSIVADPPTGVSVPVTEPVVVSPPAASMPRATAHVVAVSAPTPAIAMPDAPPMPAGPSGLSTIIPADVTATFRTHGVLKDSSSQGIGAADAGYEDGTPENETEGPYQPIAFVSPAPALDSSGQGNKILSSDQNDSKDTRSGAGVGQTAAGAGLASRPVVLQTDTAEIRYAGRARGIRTQGSEVSVSNGETLLWCLKDTTVLAGDCIVHIRAGTAAIVLHEGAVVKVRNLWESRAHSIRVLIGNKSTQIAAGQEMAVGRNDGTLAQSLQTDRTGRRGVNLVALDREKSLVRGEVSLVSLLQNSRVLRHVLRGSNATDRALADKVMKMAACLMQLTAQRGVYARVNPDSLGLKRG